MVARHHHCSSASALEALYKVMLAKLDDHNKKGSACPTYNELLKFRQFAYKMNLPMADKVQKLTDEIVVKSGAPQMPRTKNELAASKLKKTKTVKEDPVDDMVANLFAN
jgi:hypothetical protein